ncbi:hypothetical protein F4780DRAFT_772537 [Xylariomycetidae sp. FL0641]|nr:hypothetical protein F4780DRAFT_772537 [Xylariomycetidae sp. FL0641]
MKVRPFVEFGPERRELDHRRGLSRVRAAVEAGEGKEIIYLSDDFPREGVSAVPTAIHNMRQQHTRSSKGTENQGNGDTMHDGQALLDVSQDENESSALVHGTGENSIPQISVQSHLDESPEDAKSSKAASYWGFFPIGRDKSEDNVSKPEDPGVAASTSPPESSLTPRVAARRSLTDSKRPLTHMAPEVKVGPRERIVRQYTREGDVSPFDGRIVQPELQIQSQRGSIMSASQTKLTERSADSKVVTSSSKSEMDQTKRKSLPEKIDPKRTATWLRQLLGYPEDNKPKLTKRPEKIHPRHEAHEDYPLEEADSPVSRISTFSGADEADAGAIDTAMQNLEQLLTEALDIANQVSEREDCGHLDDGNLQLPVSEDKDRPSYHLNVNESGPDSSDDDRIGAALATTNEFSFLGVKRHGLAQPGMYSGNIQASSVGGSRNRLCQSIGSREVSTHVPEDDCVLPMPPPDNRLKRHHAAQRPQAYKEDDALGPIRQPHSEDVPNSREVREYIRVFHQPPIAPRSSSRYLREFTREQGRRLGSWRSSGLAQIRRRDFSVCSLDGGTSDDMIDFSTQYNRSRDQANTTRPATQNGGSQRRGMSSGKRTHEQRNISLKRRSHVSLREGQKFSLTKSVKRQPTIARDWSPARKRLVATVACISTALIGVLVGIYAGIVPSVQYYIADFNHYSILGNVGFYLGMALSTFFFWPLPLLHGRKPYIVFSLCVAMPLLFPQAITVNAPRSPYNSAWKWALLFPRALMGCALGFASMNFHSILTDLFGASLMSSNPHQEVVDHYDVRRHGGGLGVWLGIWTWCFIGSLGVGFMIGAVVIDSLAPSWGLFISVILLAVVLLLNVLCPEVRRAAWRRSVAEVRTGVTISRRVARGEIKMHRVQTGPTWWGQEVYHGVALSLEMLRQPGFTVIAVYYAWIYAQVVLIIVLLGSLASRFYRLRSPYVGAAVSSVAIGALLAVPFQKANLFSRARSMGPQSNRMTLDRNVNWTSHLVRRVVFTLVLPIAGVLYTVVSTGPPMHIFFPCFFAASIGRPRSSKDSNKRTNYSSFPRVTAGLNTIHSIGFVFAAGATGIGGIATRSMGQRASTGVVASILFLLSLLLFGVLARFRKIQIIPNSKTMEMDKWTQERRDSLRRRASAIAAAKASGQADMSSVPEDDVGWRPLILGNPAVKHRRMNVLELGSLTRWTEIRKKNRLVDASDHLNRQAVGLARDEIVGEMQHGAEHIGSLVRKVSKRSQRSKRSQNSSENERPRIELHDLSPPGPAGAGLEHHHAEHPQDVYRERECFMGQTVREERESPYLESEHGDQVVDKDRARREHAHHEGAKVQPAHGAHHRQEHGSHMDESKVRQADVLSGYVEHGHRAHMHASKVRPADTEFEDVDLTEKKEKAHAHWFSIGHDKKD